MNPTKSLQNNSLLTGHQKQRAGVLNGTTFSKKTKWINFKKFNSSSLYIFSSLIPSSSSSSLNQSMAVSLRPGMSLSGSCYDNGLETKKRSSVFPLDQSMALKTELKGRQFAVIDDRNQVTSLIISSSFSACS